MSNNTPVSETGHNVFRSKAIYWAQVALLLAVSVITVMILYAWLQVDQLAAERRQFIRMPMPPELEAAIWPNHESWTFYQSLINRLILPGLIVLGIFLLLAFRNCSRWYQAYVPGYILMWIIGLQVTDWLPIWALLVLGPLGWPVMSSVGMTALFFGQTMVVSMVLWLASLVTGRKARKWMLALFRLSWFFAGVMNIPLLASQTLR